MLQSMIDIEVKMRIFKTGNWSEEGEACPICGTKDKGQVVLVGIDGTENGNNIEAKQVHVKCLNLRLIKNDSEIIYQLIK